MAHDRMRVGIVLPIGQEDGMAAPPSYREVRDVARAAEAADLDSVWVFDHLLFRFDGETTGIHECWTILAAIAEATERVQLGSIVMCTSFRNPALLAKMAATLDHLSDGRLILGVGCGWHDPEYEAFGYPDRPQGRPIRRVVDRHPRPHPDGPRGPRRALGHGQGHGPHPAGTPGPADPHRRQAPTDAGADRAPRRRLEPRLVRGAGRPPRRRPGGPGRGVRRRRARPGNARHHGRRHRALPRPDRDAATGRVDTGEGDDRDGGGGGGRAARRTRPSGHSTSSSRWSRPRRPRWIASPRRSGSPGRRRAVPRPRPAPVSG